MSDKELLDILMQDKSAEELDALQRRLDTAKLARLLHTLLCPLNHETECDFYREEQVAEKSQARKEWERRVERLLNTAQIEKAEETALLVRELPPLLQKLAPQPAVIRFLSLLLSPLLVRATEFQGAQLEAPSSAQADPSSSGESPPE